MNSIVQVKNEMRKLGSRERACLAQRFFKTRKGEYGEGDTFIGVTVPVVRVLARKYKDLSLDEIRQLLYSDIHEERLFALIVLQYRFVHGNDVEQKEIYDFYIQHIDRVNNWDLVDTSAYKIVGVYLNDGSRKILYKLVRSRNMWHRRIAIISTLYFIKNDDFKDCVALAEILLHDKEDLMHKAVGWMLREVGKRDMDVLKDFLDRHVSVMPRTTLRYAIEMMSERERKHYLGR